MNCKYQITKHTSLIAMIKLIKSITPNKQSLNRKVTQYQIHKKKRKKNPEFEYT